MKKIPVTVAVNFPETLKEAIAMFGEEMVFTEFIRAHHLGIQQKFHAAGKIEYSK